MWVQNFITDVFQQLTGFTVVFYIHFLLLSPQTRPWIQISFACCSIYWFLYELLKLQQLQFPFLWKSCSSCHTYILYVTKYPLKIVNSYNTLWVKSSSKRIPHRTKWYSIKSNPFSKTLWSNSNKKKMLCQRAL